ncbi:hypothetical protein GCM10012276_21530 [Nocardioides deserti]|nr:hypothetical protein GCM10012276_21530 [Nocardioides deserti]
MTIGDPETGAAAAARATLARSTGSVDLAVAGPRPGSTLGAADGGAAIAGGALTPRTSEEALRARPVTPVRARSFFTRTRFYRLG